MVSAEPIPDTREQSTPVVANGGRGFLFRTLFPRRGVHWMCRLAVFPSCFDQSSHYLGDVQAADQNAAEAAAASEFNLSDDQRKRVVVRERD